MPWFPSRLGVTATVAAAVAVTAIIAAVASHFTSEGTTSRPTTAVSDTALSEKPLTHSGPANTAPIARANAVPALTALGRSPNDAPRVAAPAHRATMPLVLTAADHRHCPAAAAACVDLTRHITWLQSNGKTTFGPIQMEPGRPGGGHETPRGTFWVQWKAGPSLISNIYHEPMPWATFFAAGGIAFHGGSLTAWSHGCVHLTDQNAHFYNEHLPIGAEVVVF
jgi:lipoprotein-anchoring transpeptidase ErfK/SrfK